MLWTEVWPTRAPKGVRSAPGLWLSRPRSASHGRVRVRLFVVDLWLGTSRSSRVCLCARVSRVPWPYVFKLTAGVVVFSVGVNEGSKHAS